MGDRGRVAPPGVTRQSAPPRQQGLFCGQWRTPQQSHINAAQQPQQVAGTDVAAPVRMQRVKRSVKIAVNVQAAGNICSGQAERREDLLEPRPHPAPLALSSAARQHLYERDHGSDYQRRRCRPASPKWVEIAPRGKHRRIDQPTRQPRPSLTALLVARRAGGEQHECGREGPRSRLGRQPAVTQPPPSALLRRGLRKGPRRSALLGQRLQSTPPELQKANGRRSTAFSPGLLA